MKQQIATVLAAACLTLAAVPAGLSSYPQKAYACSKGEDTSAEYDFAAASNVFYGMVTKVENVYYKGNLYKMATFVNDTHLKGNYVRVVLTATDSDQCEARFEEGRNYLVYAQNGPGRAYASVFNVFEGEEALSRANALKDRDMTPTPEPGVHAITLYSGADTAIMLNGNKQPASPAPLYYNSTLYVPMTFFRDILGYVTIWNSDENRYEILLRSEWAGIAAKGDPAQSEFKDLPAGIPVGSDPFEAYVTYSDVQAKVDGKWYAPEKSPFNYGGVVYVPLRDTAEKLGIQVNWDPASHTAYLNDIRSLDRQEHPMLILKLMSVREGEPDIIVDRIENDKATYRIDRKLEYGEQPQQFEASFADLVKDADGNDIRQIRLLLQKEERQYELIVKESFRSALLTDPAARALLNLTLGRDFYSWPDDGVIGLANLR